MSSAYVREQVNTLLAANQVMTFYDTVNQQQQPNDLMWVTVSFNADFVELMTYCGHQQERGVITLEFFGKSGIGYQDLLHGAESVLEHVHNYQDSNQALLLDHTHIINDNDNISSPRWYEVTADLDYYYSFN